MRAIQIWHMTGSSAHSCPSKKGDGGRERPQIGTGGFPPEADLHQQARNSPEGTPPKMGAPGGIAHARGLGYHWPIQPGASPGHVQGDAVMADFTLPDGLLERRSERAAGSCARATSWTALPRRPLRPFPPGQCNGCVRGRRQIGARRPRRSLAALGIELYPAI